MDQNFAPTTVTVEDVRIVNGTAYFRGTDQNDAPFVATLDLHIYGPFVGPLTWFSRTVEQKVKDEGTFALTSRYDEESDNWFTRAGNYSIRSDRFTFHSVDNEG
jgi:hypothetical protein